MGSAARGGPTLSVLRRLANRVSTGFRWEAQETGSWAQTLDMGGQTDRLATDRCGKAGAWSSFEWGRLHGASSGKADICFTRLGALYLQRPHRLTAAQPRTPAPHRHAPSWPR